MQPQRDLAVAYDSVGDMLQSLGSSPEALTSYRDGLAIRERLAKVDPANTGWQRDLAVSYGKIGDALPAQGKLDEALKAYRDGLAIPERLAAADGSNTLWQSDLSIFHEKVGNVLEAQGQLEDALTAFETSLALHVALVAKDRTNAQWQRELQSVVDRTGGIAYRLVLAGDFAPALEATDRAMAAAPAQLWLSVNRAHALMLLARVDEARALYLQHRGQTLQNGKTWEGMVLEDFINLRKAGLTHPLMDEIEKRFAGGG